VTVSGEQSAVSGKNREQKHMIKQIPICLLLTVLLRGAERIGDQMITDLGGRENEWVRRDERNLEMIAPDREIT